VRARNGLRRTLCDTAKDRTWQYRQSLACDRRVLAPDKQRYFFDSTTHHDQSLLCVFAVAVTQTP